MADSTIRAEPASIFSNKSRHVAALLQVFVYVWALFGKSKHGRLQFGDQRRSRSGSFISTVKLFLFLPTTLTTSWKSFFSLRTSPFPFRSNTKWKDVERGRCFTLFVFLARIEEKQKHRYTCLSRFFSNNSCKDIDSLQVFSFFLPFGGRTWLVVVEFAFQAWVVG